MEKNVNFFTEICDANVSKWALETFGESVDNINIERHKAFIMGAIAMRQEVDKLFNLVEKDKKKHVLCIQGYKAPYTTPPTSEIKKGQSYEMILDYKEWYVIIDETKMPDVYLKSFFEKQQ